MQFKRILFYFVLLFINYKLYNIHLQNNLIKLKNYYFFFIIIFITLIDCKIVHNGVRQRNSSLPLWKYIDQQSSSNTLNNLLYLDQNTAIRRGQNWKQKNEILKATTTTIMRIRNSNKINDYYLLNFVCKNYTNL